MIETNTATSISISIVFHIRYLGYWLFHFWIPAVQHFILPGNTSVLILADHEYSNLPWKSLRIPAKICCIKLIQPISKFCDIEYQKYRISAPVICQALVETIESTSFDCIYTASPLRIHHRPTVITNWGHHRPTVNTNQGHPQPKK